MTRARPLLALAVLCGGCVINGDKYPRPRDLVPVWMVDRPRLLAMAGEPAEARPGDLVRFSALLAQPPGQEEDFVTVWIACPPTEEAGCSTDLSGLTTTTGTPSYEDIGLIGIEPGLPPIYAVPDDLLDGLTDDEKLEGLEVTVQATALPAETMEDPEALEDLDFAVVEAGFKRLVVSLATTPNQNPSIGALAVDDLSLPDGALVHVDPSQSYEIGARLPEDAIETYEFLNSEGVVEQRVEEPYVAWFATGGDLQEEVTLYPYLDATWVAPEASGERGAWYAVLRDRRGGMAWKVQEWIVD